MEQSVQEAIQELITQLIRSLGPNHPRLLSLMRSFSPGAETLALRVLTIFTENTRPTPPLVALVKELISERELDARFLIPIIAEMDKVCLAFADPDNGIHAHLRMWNSIGGHSSTSAAYCFYVEWRS